MYILCENVYITCIQCENVYIMWLLSKQVVTNTSQQELKMREYMRLLQEYLMIRKIPKALADKVRIFFFFITLKPRVG